MYLCFEFIRQGGHSEFAHIAPTPTHTCPPLCCRMLVVRIHTFADPHANHTLTARDLFHSTAYASALTHRKWGVFCSCPLLLHRVDNAYSLFFVMLIPQHDCLCFVLVFLLLLWLIVCVFVATIVVTIFAHRDYSNLSIVWSTTTDSRPQQGPSDRADQQSFGVAGDHNASLGAAVRRLFDV